LAPAPQIPGDVTDQVPNRHQTAVTGRQLPHTVAKPGQRAFRGNHVK
jgi:hypothetical protein